MEAEHRHISDAAHSPPVVLGAQGMTRVFNHDESVPPRDLEDRVQFRWMPGIVDGKNRLRPRGDFLFNLLGIEIERIPADIREHRSSALIQNAIRRRRESHGGGYRFVASSKSSRKRCRMQRGRTRCETDGMRCPHARSESFLEFTHPGACRQPIRTQNLHYSLNVGFIHRLSTVRKKIRAYR